MKELVDHIGMVLGTLIGCVVGECFFPSAFYGSAQNLIGFMAIALFGSLLGFGLQAILTCKPMPRRTMICIDSGDIGDPFDTIANKARTAADQHKQTAFFYWNVSDLVLVAPNTSLPALVEQLRAREAARRAIRSTLTLQKRADESHEDFVSRAVNLSIEQNSEVTIIDGRKWLDIHPWAPEEAVLLEWRRRQARHVRTRAVLVSRKSRSC